MLVAALIGVGVAWAINAKRFGTEARFGPFRSGSNTPIESLQLQSSLESPADQSPDGQPIAEVIGEPAHDFGIMAVGSTAQHSFVIANNGDAPLELRVGPSTCKCTVGELASNTIAPGEQSEVRLGWKVQTDDDQFSQSASILTNDPLQTELRFRITGKAVQDIEIVPASWSFGEAAPDEPLEVVGKIYSFLDHDIRPTELKYSDEELNELAEFEVRPFEPIAETDGVRAAARQGFEVRVTIAPGFRQGRFLRRFAFCFERDDAGGQTSASASRDQDREQCVFVPTRGRVAGALSMVENTNLQRIGEAYLYDFGRIRQNDDTRRNAFVVLKGSERDNTSLRIGEVSPAGSVRAALGEPRGDGPKVLIPLEIELIPGRKPIRRLGKGKDDYGSVWIESDNPRVPKMRVALKFSLDGR